IVDDPICRALMDKMMSERPELWAEDIGEEA
ncbi:tRNA-specific adenosine deaminase, partial [Pimelobacter sp. 30-1]|nr:tRNA-specific adenosine deaminase [Pimelobacter sp. 30-1]MBU2698819.1 tRNA-specific adenosine deaminase [Pimelobacter sp. 30-1]